jgi:hypothetical protein
MKKVVIAVMINNAPPLYHYGEQGDGAISPLAPGIPCSLRRPGMTAGQLPLPLQQEVMPSFVAI